jgi:hypothetical protein
MHLFILLKLKVWTAQERSLILTYLSVPQGHDTTSAGMCWAVFLLGLHPDVQVSFNGLVGLFWYFDS